MPLPSIDLSLFDYTLPDASIAKYPLPNRDHCKLLAWHQGTISDHRFWDLPTLLPEHSLLIRNNTKVIKARLLFQKETGATIEIFCLEPLYPESYEENLSSTTGCTWQCLIGNAKRWRGEWALTKTITTPRGTSVTLEATKGTQEGVIHFAWNDELLSFAEILELWGKLPIPPYLNRDTEASDLDNYQTVYAVQPGSVAAPTAGLHFTPEIAQAVTKHGHSFAELTLHVGAGTFIPIKDSDISQHKMHSEFCSISKNTIEELLQHVDKPLIPVGTTSVRTIESLYYLACLMPQTPTDHLETHLHLSQWAPYQLPASQLLSKKEALQRILHYVTKHQLEQIHFTTSLLILPGYQFRMANGLITNFHQPSSTLLLLIAAMMGETWKLSYQHALEHQYRFLSYGDAMLILP